AVRPGAASHSGCPGRRRASAPAADLVEVGDGAAEVGDDDGAADDEGDGEGLEELLVGEAELGAADEVVGDAVVAAEDERGDEAEELLGGGVEGSILVDAGVEGPEAADLEVALVEDALVQLLAEAMEVFEAHEDAVMRSAMASSVGGPSLSRYRVQRRPGKSSSTTSVRTPLRTRAAAARGSGATRGRSSVL